MYQRSILVDFLHDEEGATAIEYALIGSLVSTFIIISVLAFSAALSNVFDTWSNAVQGAVGGGS